MRTVPERIYAGLGRGEFSILESYLRAIRSAERLVYLESQFLWSPELVGELERKLRRPPDDRFRLVVLLPVKPNNGRDDTRGQLGKLAAADDGAGRFLACTLRQRGADASPVYVHAKIGIVDDRWLTLGSANLNEHSLLNDTEVNIATWDEQLARATRLRALERAPRTRRLRARRRHDGRRRRALAPDRRRAAAPARSRASRRRTGSRSSPACRAVSARCAGR